MQDNDNFVEDIYVNDYREDTGDIVAVALDYIPLKFLKRRFVNELLKWVDKGYIINLNREELLVWIQRLK